MDLSLVTLIILSSLLSISCSKSQEVMIPASGNSMELFQTDPRSLLNMFDATSSFPEEDLRQVVTSKDENPEWIPKEILDEQDNLLSNYRINSSSQDDNYNNSSDVNPIMREDGTKLTPQELMNIIAIGIIVVFVFCFICTNCFIAEKNRSNFYDGWTDGRGEEPPFKDLRIYNYIIIMEPEDGDNYSNITNDYHNLQQEQKGVPNNSYMDQTTKITPL